MIRKSFKDCGPSVKTDSAKMISDDRQQPCAAGWEGLAMSRQREDRCEAAKGEEDEEELFNNELGVVDEEEDYDNGEDDEYEE